MWFCRTGMLFKCRVSCLQFSALASVSTSSDRSTCFWVVLFNESPTPKPRDCLKPFWSSRGAKPLALRGRRLSAAITPTRSSLLYSHSFIRSCVLFSLPPDSQSRCIVFAGSSLTHPGAPSSFPSEPSLPSSPIPSLGKPLPGQPPAASRIPEPMTSRRS